MKPVALAILTLVEHVLWHEFRQAAFLQRSTLRIAASYRAVRRFTPYLLLLISLVHTPGYAQEDSLLLNGIAAQSQFKSELYLAALYLQRITNDPIEAIEQNSNKRMELRVLAERWSARSFTNHWNQAILINNDEVELKTHAKAIRQFTSLVRDELIFGDEIVIAYLAGNETRISVNGVTLLTVEARPLAFFQLIQRAWLGPRPPSSSFKFDLLNLPAGDLSSELLIRFEATVPPSGRAKTMVAWRDDESNEDEEPATPVVAAAPRPAPKPVPKPAPKPAPKPEPVAEPTPEVAESPAEEASAQEPEASKADAASGLLALYQSNALKRVYAHVIYPERAIDRNQEGTVVIAVTVNRKGKVLGLTTAKETKYKLLNNAASKAVTKATPFPAVPKKLKGEEFDMSFPITFRIPR